MRAAGLVEIKAINPNIVLNLRYATSDNFTGKVLYDTPDLGYCEPELAHRLSAIQQRLEAILPCHAIMVWDAARPISVQRHMFRLVQGTAAEPYIANPNGKHAGGFHNYGMAVDITIVDPHGKEIDMGTTFDSFRPEAHVGGELQLLREGRISSDAYRNRMLLYYLTAAEGLQPYAYEWWHYQLHQLETDKAKFHLLDF